VEPDPIRFPLPSASARFFKAQDNSFSGQAQLQTEGQRFVG
jgi:hypothetical protein